MNPMIRKELRMYMRNKRGWWFLSAYQLILIAITTYIYWDKALRFDLSGAVIGETIFNSVIFTQLAVLLLLAPIFSAASITIEYEQKTISGLLSSLLSSFEIWWGKFVASILYLGLLWISSLPILSIVLVLGGVGEKEILIGFCGTGILIGCFCSIGILFSSWFRRSVHSTALTYAFLIALNVITGILCIIERNFGVFNSWLHLPTLLNPFYGLSLLPLDRNIAIWHGEYDWYLSFGFFVLLGVVSALLAIRNLRKAVP
jgi:ABC-2 type transport system permease protein